MTYIYITLASDLPNIAAKILASPLISLDIETTGFDPHTCVPRLLSLNNGVDTPWVIDLFKTSGPGPILDALRGPGIKIGQNLKFEAKFMLHHWRLELNHIFDTYRASALIYNGRLGWKHDLFSLYKRELDMEPKVADLAASGWGGDLTTEQIEYAADDVTHLPKLREILKSKLIALGLVEVAKIEFAAVMPEAALELNGFRLDSLAWLDLAASNAKQEVIFRNDLLANLPHPEGQESLPGFQNNLNLQSPQQLLKSLHRKGMLVPDTNENTLAMWSDEYPIVKKILDYREYAQCGKSFGPKYLLNINSTTGRIHTSLYPFTGAGRYSSSRPNLQQIPRKKEFRDCFRAPPGKVLVIADYSQIELRLCAEISGDEALIDVYVRGEDAHSQTASLVSGVPIAEVTKEQRQTAKALNFGLIYGMGAKKLPMYAKKGYGVTLTEREAFKMHRLFFEAYPGIKRWHNKVFDDRARAQGMTRTKSGRLRYLDPDLYNEHANSPVQGSGADGLKNALSIVYHHTKNYAKLVHCVHDEIILEVDDEPATIPRAEKDLEQSMIDGMKPFLKRVPVVVEVGHGPSWASK